MNTLNPDFFGALLGAIAAAAFFLTIAATIVLAVVDQFELYWNYDRAQVVGPTLLGLMGLCVVAIAALLFWAAAGRFIVNHIAAGPYM